MYVCSDWTFRGRKLPPRVYQGVLPGSPHGALLRTVSQLSDHLVLIDHLFHQNITLFSQVGVPGEGAVPGLVPEHLLLQLSAAQPATMRLYLPAQVRKVCAHSPGGSSQSRLPQQFTGTWWKESGEVYYNFLLNLAWFSLAPCVLFLSGREFPTDTFCVWFRRVRPNEARARFERTGLK